MILGPMLGYNYVIVYWGNLSFLLPSARAQTCTPLGCIQTYVLMNSSIPSTRDPPYACRGERVTYFCQVLNGASLQWASEPDICTSVPISYTSGDNEGELRLRGAYQSNLTSVVRNPPNSNFTSSLLLDTSGSMDSVTVVCGDQISSCISVQNQSVISITGKYMYVCVIPKSWSVTLK